MNELQRIATAVAAMYELKGKSISDAALDLYVDAVKDLGADAVEQAVLKANRTATFCPQPAELRELAGVASNSDRAVIAWEAILDAIPGVGSYRAVNFDDPAINAAIRNMGGWPVLLDRTGDDFFKWARQEFCRIYESYVRAGVSEEAAKPLMGIGDSRTPVEVRTGLPPAKVKRIESGQIFTSGLLELKTP